MSAGSTSAGWLKGYAVAIVSLLSGAAVVHNIYKPDLARLRLLPCYLALLFIVCIKKKLKLLSCGATLWQVAAFHVNFSCLGWHSSVHIILVTLQAPSCRHFPGKSLRRQGRVGEAIETGNRAVAEPERTGDRALLCRL